MEISTAELLYAHNSINVLIKLKPISFIRIIENLLYNYIIHQHEFFLEL